MAWLGRDGAPDVRGQSGAPLPGQGLAGITQEVPAAPPSPFAVTPEAGPWMICAASYTGPDAPEMAYKVCLELRKRYPSTYTYNRATEERRQLQEELDRWNKEHPDVPRPRRRVRIEEQCAVLIGGFRDVDAASAELKKIRLLPPPDVRLAPGKLGFDTYDIYEPTKDNRGVELKRYAVNPFHTAFVIHNPTIPMEKPQQSRVDPAWKRLNADEPRSLLNCPKPWTLVVQEYVGGTVILPTAGASSFLEKLGFSSEGAAKRLDACAMRARQLAEVLDHMGFKTYILHTRTTSVVSVGGFNGPDDPELLRVQAQLRHVSFRDDRGQVPMQMFNPAVPKPVPRP
jgi:hypothetical protein